MALVIRVELFAPGLDVVPTNEQYNQLFTMHGTIMLLMFATPLFAGFANVAMPLQIGAPDVAFPRLNALAYWLFIFGSLIAVAGFLTPQGAAAFGWIGLRAAVEHDVLAGRRRQPLGLRPRAERFRHDPRCRQLHHHDHHDARARHDDVPDADLHLEHPGDVDPRAAGVPGARRRPLRARRRPRLRGAPATIPPTAARSSGSTCSGSSATPRSTSSRCRSSASSPRCSRSSAASRSSATRP